MTILKEFLQTYMPAVLYTALTAIAGFLGVQIKRVYDRITQDETKKKTVDTVVRAVEQMYKDLHGEEKKRKAIESVRQILDAKGVPIADIELEMLLEAAVAAFGKSKPTQEDAA